MSPGRITARSKDEIGNLAADKHEKALAGNVISPQDIGVTYNMIGGSVDLLHHFELDCFTSLMDEQVWMM